MKNNKGKKVALLTGLAIAGAGAAYLYATKDGKKKQKEIRAWATKAKSEVLNKAKKIKGIKETAYNEIIENVLSSYSSLKDVNKKELSSLAKELKSGWKHLKSETKSVVKKPNTKKPQAKSKPKVKTAVKKVISKAKKAVK